MTVLAASQVVTPHGVLSPGLVEVEDGRISSVVPTTGRVPARVLAPGLVDLQVIGVGPVDLATAAGSDWDRLDALLVAQGTTSWLPTLISAPLDAYDRPLAEIAAAAVRSGARPQVVGAHLEGPFLGGRAGAHAQPMPAEVDLGWVDALPDIVRMVTLGAEVPGAPEAVARLSRRGVLAALGHGAPTHAQATEAIDAGARLVTHGFNAMAPLAAREPGLVGAMLTDDRVAVSLIADGVHVHRAVLEVAFRCKPTGRIVLVTDSVAAGAGQLGRAPVAVRDGAPRRPDGTLAGSIGTLDAALGRVVHQVGVGLVDAVRAASTTPAALLGLHDRGALAAGRRADIVALDPTSLRCTATWVEGQQVHG